jgi:hypothetical protein
MAGDKMSPIFKTIAQSPTVRAVLLVLIVAPLIFYFGFTPSQRTTIGLLAAYYLGAWLPALGLAAAVGWLAWSREWFWIVLIGGITITIMLQLYAAGLFERVAADAMGKAVLFFVIMVLLVAYLWWVTSLIERKLK